MKKRIVFVGAALVMLPVVALAAAGDYFLITTFIDSFSLTSPIGLFLPF